MPVNNPQAIFDLVRSTREILLPHWGAIEAKRKEGIGASAVVTELDRTVEQYLRDGLAKIEPDIAFTGEEGGGSREAERFWLADPIDGTMRFIRGLPDCAVMLALMEENQVKLSTIYDFVNDEMYHAIRGEGAFKNTERLQVSNRPIEEAYVVLESNITKPTSTEIWNKLQPLVAGVMNSSVSGHEFTLVASGKIEGRICVDPFGKDYDFAAGTFLVEEAGGIVANIGSRDYDFRNTNFIAANPAVFEALTSGPDAPFPIKN